MGLPGWSFMALGGGSRLQAPGVLLSLPLHPETGPLPSPHSPRVCCKGALSEAPSLDTGFPLARPTTQGCQLCWLLSPQARSGQSSAWPPAPSCGGEAALPSPGRAESAWAPFPEELLLRSAPIPGLPFGAQTW